MKKTMIDIEKYFLKINTKLTLSENNKIKKIIKEFFKFLESGRLRAANKNHNGEWKVDSYVKKGILLAFKFGKIISMGNDFVKFSDKEFFVLQKIDSNKNIRIVPGGTSLRCGSYIGNNVTIMPPAFVNIGVFLDDKTMIDSHALVGSCAQIGKKVHISAAAQIGGVLEPVGAMPVIIEDNCLIGGNTGIYEGTIVHERAVIGAGVILTSSTKIFDIVNKRIIPANKNGVLEVPADSVVIPGSRQISDNYAKKYGLNLYCPIIVKYRDKKTNAKIALEDCLR